MSARFFMAMALLVASGASAQGLVHTGTPKYEALELKLGGYKPLIVREAGLASDPYRDVFGAGAMLLAELEYDRQLWQEVGTIAVGFSIGYAEKFGSALVGEQNGAAVTQEVSERTGLKVLPLKLMGVYRFDYAALHWNVPVVPYGKVGLAYTPWWSVKGANVEFADGLRGAGAQWGWAAVGGISLMLDFLEPRLAKDFDSDMGVNHSYLFAEYVHQDVNDFGAGGLDLSSRHWMFGLTLEY
ncbi:MAG: MXAN_2562 family outer membrane beta-barrel protein [Myxococcota bacterium]